MQMEMSNSKNVNVMSRWPTIVCHSIASQTSFIITVCTSSHLVLDIDNAFLLFRNFLTFAKINKTTLNNQKLVHKLWMKSMNFCLFFMFELEQFAEFVGGIIALLAAKRHLPINTRGWLDCIVTTDYIVEEP